MITLNKKQLSVIKFPSGELHIRYKDLDLLPYSLVEVKFESSDDMIALMLLDDLLYTNNVTYKLSIPYFPSSRQDRCELQYESRSLQVYANIINNLKCCTHVEILDPHSEATKEAIKLPLIIKSMEESLLLSSYLAKSNDEVILVAPDLGASEKVRRIADITKKPMLQAIKIRDYITGNIIGLELINELKITDNTVFLVLDDICDGGRTFIEWIKKIKEKYGNNVKVDLLVSHGFFSNGMDILKDAGYSNILFINDMRKEH